MKPDDIAAEEADHVDCGADNQRFKGSLEVLDLGQLRQRCWSSGDEMCRSWRSGQSRAERGYTQGRERPAGRCLFQPKVI